MGALVASYFTRGTMIQIQWKIKNNAQQCAVPRCRNPIGPTYLGLEICWRCFDKHCNKRFLQRYAKGNHSKIYLLGRYFTTGNLLVRTSQMGIIKLGDKVKMDPENCGAYSQFLKKGDGSIIGIHPLGRSDLGKTVRKWPLENVGHLTVRCDNGLVIIIGPSRLVEINGYKRPDNYEEGAPVAARRRRPAPTKRKTVGVRIKKKAAPKTVRKRVPRRRSMLDDLWG
jgi:hypothetical protein